MADAARKEKLAAAKKKLKKFQKTGKTPAPQNGHVPNSTNGKGNAADALSQESGENGTQTPPLQNNTASANSSIYSTPAAKTNLPAQQRLSESAEQLQHFSRQLTGLIEESASFLQNDDEDDKNTKTIEELEARNQELAKLLNQHNAMNEQLNKQVQELRQQNHKLSQGIDLDKKSFEDKLKREMGALKEQLQVHIQTIGILVAEKTELQSAVNQHQKQSEQRLEEIDDLSGRLKASRQRVADLERSFTSASSSNQKHEKESKEQKKEIDRLKMDLYKLTKSNEEHQQQTSELQGKLRKKVADCAKLEDQLIEVKGRLEMTDLHVQQLQNTGEQVDQADQIQELLAEKGELLEKLRVAEEALSRSGEERSEAAGQYEAYIEQLQQHSHTLAAQATTLRDERDQYAAAAQQLQAQLSAFQQQGEANHAVTAEVEKARQELEERLMSVTGELQDLQHKHQAQVNDNAQLSRLVDEKETRLLELDMRVQQLNDQQVDKESLLETMQGDKTALSRAMAQNKELKNQLTELQNGFVKMSNDNMELMTQLSTAEHSAKDLTTKLSSQEEQLKALREQVSVLEAQQSQGQAQDASVILQLQQELAAAQARIESLSTEQAADSYRRVSEAVEAEDESAAAAAVQEVRAELAEVVEQLREEQHQRHLATDQLHKLQHELALQTPATLNGDVINKAQFEALQHAMKQLEGKFSAAMRSNADLTDQKENLEHIILQLQGETETIGEYVSLYQTQRSLLRERSAEKDEYIWRLAREREELGDKLAQLQAAVVTLLAERNQLHQYPTRPGQEREGAAAEGSENASIAPPVANGAQGDFGKLSNSQLEDWPDYTSESDSEASEVEAIIGDSTPPSKKSPAPAPTHSTPHATKPPPPPPQAPTEPDHTAQRIMHLLTEIGHSNLVDRSMASEGGYVNCDHCRGKLLHV